VAQASRHGYGSPLHCAQGMVEGRVVVVVVVEGHSMVGRMRGSMWRDIQLHISLLHGGLIFH